MNILATALATGLALLISLPTGAIAQQPPASDQPGALAPGMLTSRALKKLPDDLTIFVSPYDDSELNLQLKKDFESHLGREGQVRIAAKSAAGFLLLFETAVVPAEQAPYRPSLGSAHAGSGGVDVNVNVWSSTQESVLGGRQAAEDIASSLFHINATLRDQSSSEVVWQGDAYYVLSGPETERVARAMVAPLVDKIGQSVVREPFEIE